MLWRFSYFFWLRPPALTFAGYLANWKIFEPRKLMPLSIEDWSAPIAVMTEITEKTPIVIPVMVSAERSLFAPREVSAMAMISRNLIKANGVVERWSDGEMGLVSDRRNPSLHYSTTPFLPAYSYLN